MKRKNLIIFAGLLLATVTLSSWRLFGKEQESIGFADSPDGQQCFETGLQDKYFLGFRVSNDVAVTRVVDCDDNSIALSDWY